jgi:DNA-binding NtrC family response regulator
MAHVLIATPEYVVAELIAQLLRYKRHTFDLALSHSNAVRMLDGADYNVILAGSPTRIEHGSSELLDHLISCRKELGPRVIVLTTQVDDPGVRERVETLGAYATISMPFDVDILLELVESCRAGIPARSRWIMRVPMRIRSPRGAAKISVTSPRLEPRPN